jgi:very-short-patch-repair endonuclease
VDGSRSVMKNYGDREQLKNARRLRNNMTKAEVILWSRLRSRQINGYKFRRQQAIFEYIVDFYCHELKLIIEADGQIHDFEESPVSDVHRDKILTLNGYKIIRFSNHRIETDLSEVLKEIRIFIQSNKEETIEVYPDQEK